MKNNIYGVDMSKKLSPMQVRDALIECFYQAHCLDSQVGPSDEKSTKLYCQEIVKKAFRDSGGDFDNPSELSLKAAVANLAEFSQNFRDPEIIKKHQQEIEALIAKL